MKRISFVPGACILYIRTLKPPLREFCHHITHTNLLPKCLTLCHNNNQHTQQQQQQQPATSIYCLRDGRDLRTGAEKSIPAATNVAVDRVVAA